MTGLLTGLIMSLAGGAPARLAADVAAVSDGDRVIDIGCGPGSAVREAARRGARVTGVDPAPVMLRLARTLTADRPAITWVHGAAEDLPEPDTSATVVWSLACVHHWKDAGVRLWSSSRTTMSIATSPLVGPHRTGGPPHFDTNRCRSTSA
jgi:SAM-dependent methyltransferase